MRALSVRQPWAWLIIQGHKSVENRSRRTRHRGPLLIHAAKGMTLEEYVQAKGLAHSLGVTVPDFDELERGGIVGQVDVVDCVTEHPSPYFFGKYGYVLKDAQPLPFREYKGQLGIFEVQDIAGTESQSVEPELAEATQETQPGISTTCGPLLSNCKP